MKLIIFVLAIFAMPVFAADQYACFAKGKDYSLPETSGPDSIKIDGDKVWWPYYKPMRSWENTWERNPNPTRNISCTLTYKEYLSNLDQLKSYCWKQEELELHVIYAQMNRTAPEVVTVKWDCIEL